MFRLWNVIGVIIALVSVACATPERMKAFRSELNLSSTSRLFNTACGVCHTAQPKHNAFGIDLNNELRSGSNRILSWQRIQNIGPKDSDGDGWPNADELAADTLPGDRESAPEGKPPFPPKPQPAEQPKEAKAVDLEEVPMHSFHPLVVHFPIALFLFGACLDFVGWRRGDPSLRSSGWLCLLFGSISTALAVPTGIAFYLRGGFEFSGAMQNHIVLAISATVLMAATVLFRRKTVPDSNLYFLLLGTACAALILAGHFGASMVFRG